MLSLCGLLSSCADTASQRQTVYVVRPQDTIYSIAWRHGLDYRDLARWNHIGPDFRISVGQALSLAPDSGSGAARVQPSPRSSQPAAVAPRNSAVSGLAWIWPTEVRGSPIPVSGGGILLSGSLGQDIRAASAGRVVYAGNGIRGYGNLIIIKHGDSWLSAYAHNRESLVKEGEEVARGQLIAHMGEGSPQKPVLYFEIRRDGKPVDPLRYLPLQK